MMLGDHRVGTLIEVFNNDEAAQAAVRELKAVGFSDSQIHVVLHPEHIESEKHTNESESEIAEGAKTGAAAGIGIGAIWGLGVLTGIAPDLGPVIAGGAFGVFLSATAAGGTAGALVRMHTQHEESVEQEPLHTPSHTIVTVRAGTRADIACSVLNRFNRHERFMSRQAM
jgi:hypothetical protein